MEVLFGVSSTIKRGRQILSLNVVSASSWGKLQIEPTMIGAVYNEESSMDCKWIYPPLKTFFLSLRLRVTRGGMMNGAVTFLQDLFGGVFGS